MFDVEIPKDLHFSKGHPERVDQDSALRTAARETFEETGLSAGVDYTIYGNSVRFGKRPYWLGILTADAQDIRMSLREHSDYAWLTLDEARLIRGNLDVRAWVQKSQRGEFQRLLTISNDLTQRSEAISDTRSSA